MNNPLDSNETQAITEFVEKQFENSNEPDDVKDELKAFSIMHYMTCAMASKSASGSVGDMLQYPAAPRMPNTWKMRVADLAPETYSEKRVLKRLKEHFNIEEDEARQFAKGDLKTLYFEVACASLGHDASDESDLETDEYNLPISRRAELLEREQRDRNVNECTFNESTSSATDGTHVTFEEVEEAMKGLDNLFDDDN